MEWPMAKGPPVSVNTNWQLVISQQPLLRMATSYQINLFTIILSVAIMPCVLRTVLLCRLMFLFIYKYTDKTEGKKYHQSIYKS